MIDIIKNITSSRFIISKLEKTCDSVTVEKNGTIVGYVKGSTDEAPIMLATHTELPHFVCINADEGEITLHYAGPTGDNKWVNCPIISRFGVRGIITTCDEKITALVDTKERKVQIGDIFYTDVDLLEVDDNVLLHGISTLGPAASLLRCTEGFTVSRPKRDLYFVFTADGQYGYGQYATAAKFNGASEVVCFGAVSNDDAQEVCVRLCDRSFSSDKKTSEKLISCGAIPLVLREGKCASSAIQLAGIPVSQVDIPVKNIGTLRESAENGHLLFLSFLIFEFCKK